MVALAPTRSGAGGASRSARGPLLVTLLVLVAVAGAAVSVLATGALLPRHHRPEAPWSPPVDRTPAAARVVAVLRALRHAPG